MEMAKYIIAILRTQPMLVMSWGFHNAVAVENGIRFKVQGYLFKGTVEVVYDEGYDLFTVRLLNRDGSIKKEETGVYLDGLVDVIDVLVERCDNYRERVKKTYHLV